MHAVILAAGEGSRMGSQTKAVPKAFMELEGRTLYDRQRDALDGHVDEVTIVLGYAAENVVDEVGSARAVVVEDWREFENAESLRRALGGIDDDVFVLNGDVVVADSTVERMCDRHRESPEGHGAVACIRGIQNEETAIRCDDRGLVDEYGMIAGHRHAGAGIIDRSRVDRAERILRNNRTEWYPVVYTDVETEAVAIPRDHHLEINRPRDKVAAKNKLPLRSAD